MKLSRSLRCRCSKPCSLRNLADCMSSVFVRSFVLPWFVRTPEDTSVVMLVPQSIALRETSYDTLEMRETLLPKFTGPLSCACASVYQVHRFVILWCLPASIRQRG